MDMSKRRVRYKEEQNIMKRKYSTEQNIKKSKIQRRAKYRAE